MIPQVTKTSRIRLPRRKSPDSTILANAPGTSVGVAVGLLRPETSSWMTGVGVASGEFVPVAVSVGEAEIVWFGVIVGEGVSTREVGLDVFAPVGKGVRVLVGRKVRVLVGVFDRVGVGPVGVLEGVFDCVGVGTVPDAVAVEVLVGVSVVVAVSVAVVVLVGVLVGRDSMPVIGP
jgi:hypothetical protein